MALLQERLDIVGLVGAQGPCIPRWRAQHPDTSVSLLEAVRQATRTAAVLLVPSTGPPPPKAAAEGSSSGAAGSKGPNGQTSNLSGGGGGRAPRIQQKESSTSMKQATPTSATEAGLTSSRLGRVMRFCSGTDSRPPELIKSCFIAITRTEKTYLESSGGGGQGSSDTGNDCGGLCAMTMATPTPVRGGAVVGGSGGGVAATGGGAKGSRAEAAQQGFRSRVEDGLTSFLVLALGVLRLERRTGDANNCDPFSIRLKTVVETLARPSAWVQS